MTQRFKILNGLLKYLATDDDNPNPQAPAGTPLRAYQEIKAGERRVSYDRPADSNPDELLKVIINPFGEAFAPENKYIVDLSKRVDEATAMNPFKTVAGIVDIIPDNANVVKGFIPAKCVISVPDSTRDNNNARSQITGILYKKKGARSYTIPYGASDATERESTVRAKLLDAVPEGANYSLSFSSEKM